MCVSLGGSDHTGVSSSCTASLCRSSYKIRASSSYFSPCRVAALPVNFSPRPYLFSKRSASVSNTLLLLEPVCKLPACACSILKFETNPTCRYMFVYIYIYIYICIYIYIHMCMYICIRVCIDRSICTICLCIHIYMYIDISTYIYIYIYMYIYIYIYIYTYTHIHTSSLTSNRHPHKSSLVFHSATSNISQMKY